MADIPGLDVQTTTIRSYPYSSITAHVLGYVGPVTETDLEKEPWLGVPGLHIGKSGLEVQLEKSLRGEAGTEQQEVNARHMVIRTLAQEKSTTGTTVQLTLDIGLQQAVMARLAKESSAAAVVLDVHDGQVYALASHPGFDPNLFASGISQSDWDALMGDERAPLTKKLS